jgi:hypothetical protein
MRQLLIMIQKLSEGKERLFDDLEVSSIFSCIDQTY